MIFQWLKLGEICETFELYYVYIYIHVYIIQMFQIYRINISEVFPITWINFIFPIMWINFIFPIMWSYLCHQVSCNLSCQFKWYFMQLNSILCNKFNLLNKMCSLPPSSASNGQQTPRVFLTGDRIHIQMWFPSASLSVSCNMM